MDTNLVFALATFLDIHLLIVCIPNNHSHSFNLPWNPEDFHQSPTQVLFLTSEDSLELLRSRALQGSLVMMVCQEFDPNDMNLDVDALFRDDVVWLVPDNSLEGLQIGQLPLRLDSYLMSYAVDSGGHHITIFETYAFKHEKIYRGLYGTWKPVSKELSVPLDNIWERRSDLDGATVINTVLTWAPMNIVGDDMETLTGLWPDTLRTIQSSANFTMALVSPEDGVWGVQREDGSWSGMVGHLVAGIADICGASMTMSQERQEHISFTVALIDDINSLSMMNPAVVGREKAQVNLDVFLTIFTNRAWIAILVTSILASVVYAALALYPSEEQNDLTFRIRADAFAAGLNDFFANLIQRGDTGEHLKRVPSMILFLSVNAVTFMLYNYYVSDLTATMTAGGAPVRLRSFTDVLDQDYKVAILEGSHLEHTFKNADEGSPMKQIYESSLVMVPASAEYADMLKALAIQDLDGKTVIYESLFTYAGHSDILQLTQFQDTMRTQLAFGLQYNSDLKGLLDYHSMRLSQAGVLRQLVHKWLKGNRPADDSGRLFQDDPWALGYDNLFFPMLVMLVGLVAGFVLVGIEYCYRRVNAEVEEWKQEDDDDPSRPPVYFIKKHSKTMKFPYY